MNIKQFCAFTPGGVTSRERPVFVPAERKARRAQLKVCGNTHAERTQQKG